MTDFQLDQTGQEIQNNLTFVEQKKTILGSAVTNSGVGYMDGTTVHQIDEKFIGGLSDKANKDGYYDTLAAGLADNLIDRTSAGTAQSFNFRTSAGTESISDGSAIVKSIHGKTVVWNQLCENGNFASTTGWNTETGGGSFGVSNNVGILSLGGESSSTALQIYQNIDYVANHKYLLSAFFNLSNVVGSRLVSFIVYGGGNPKVQVTPTAGVWTQVSGIIQPTASGSFETNLQYLQGSVLTEGDTFSVKSFNVIDLTQMFGSGNEPSTVAEFRAMFPLDYYAYNAGTLLSYNGTGIKTVGFNLFDSETGTAALVGGTTNGYQITGDYSALTFTSDSGGTSTITPDSDGKFNVSVNGLLGVTGSGDDTCVHLVWSGYRDGEFEEYEANTLALPISTYFANGMRSAGSVYDELTPSKAITRIGAVDLGSLTWNYVASHNDIYLFTAIVPGALSRLDTTALINALTDNASITIGTQQTWISGLYRLSGYNSGINGILFTYPTNSPDDVTAWLSGTTMYYELATPTSVTISPALDLVYPVSDFGTEEALPMQTGTTPTSTNFTGVIYYSGDFTREIVNLPKNYDTTGGLDTLCSALASCLSTALNGTFTITRGAYNSSTKKHAFTCTFTANS